MSIDKLAPQAVEAEQSVLGSILIDPEAILKVADFLHPPDFYLECRSSVGIARATLIHCGTKIVRCASGKELVEVAGGKVPIGEMVGVGGEKELE